jgi:hypothetical protein
MQRPSIGVVEKLSQLSPLYSARRTGAFSAASETSSNHLPRVIATIAPRSLIDHRRRSPGVTPKDTAAEQWRHPTSSDLPNIPKLTRVSRSNHLHSMLACMAWNTTCSPQEGRQGWWTHDEMLM